MRRALWKNSGPNAHADPSSCHLTLTKTITINLHPLFKMKDLIKESPLTAPSLNAALLLCVKF